jgi:hypothetical protein
MKGEFGRYPELMSRRARARIVDEDMKDERRVEVCMTRRSGDV